MSGNTSLVSATPNFVAGTFGAKDVRLATVGNALPGLFNNGDFTVVQRAAGANMSVDIGIGRCYVAPGVSTHQGSYLVTSGATYATNGTATFNTSSDGGYTWTAADATNPRIDLLCIEVKDTVEDASGTTGWRFRIVDGTPNASATHQLATTYWPAVPSGCVPIAAIKIPAADTTISTTDITNLNPIGGAGRWAYNSVATAETSTSATYARLSNSNGTADFVCAYVPHANARVRIGMRGHWKISVASGTQGIALFVNDTQLKFPITTGAPLTAGYEITSLGTLYSHFATYAGAGLTATNAFFATVAGTVGDVSDVTTGQSMGWGSSSTTGGHNADFSIMGLTAGWYVIEARYKTSANTLSVRNRYMWANVEA